MPHTKHPGIMSSLLTTDKTQAATPSPEALDNGPEHRAFNQFAQNTRHNQGFFIDNEAQYRTRRAGPVMNVKVIACRFDEADNTWKYQLKDADGTPVRTSRESFEPDWIPEKKLI